MTKKPTNSFLSFTLDDENNIIIQKSRMKMIINDKYNNSECFICLNKFSETSSDIALLHCGHKFCVECINSVRKKDKTQFYKCPTCKTEITKGHIVDYYNKILCFINVKSNTNALQENLNCNRCKTNIHTKYYLSCFLCNISFHGSCIRNFTNNMKNSLFLCNKCLAQNYKEEIYNCDKCDYKTIRKDNLVRHKRQSCGKFTCLICKLFFQNKKELKFHEKNEEKLAKAKKIMEFMSNGDKNTVVNLVDKLSLDDDLSKEKGKK